MGDTTQTTPSLTSVDGSVPTTTNMADDATAAVLGNITSYSYCDLSVLSTCALWPSSYRYKAFMIFFDACTFLTACFGLYLLIRMIHLRRLKLFKVTGVRSNIFPLYWLELAAIMAACCSLVQFGAYTTSILGWDLIVYEAFYMFSLPLVMVAVTTYLHTLLYPLAAMEEALQWYHDILPFLLFPSFLGGLLRIYRTFIAYKLAHDPIVWLDATAFNTTDPSDLTMDAIDNISNYTLTTPNLKSSSYYSRFQFCVTAYNIIFALNSILVAVYLFRMRSVFTITLNRLISQRIIVKEQTQNNLTSPAAAEDHPTAAVDAQEYIQRLAVQQELLVQQDQAWRQQHVVNKDKARNQEVLKQQQARLERELKKQRSTSSSSSSSHTSLYLPSRASPGQTDAFLQSDHLNQVNGGGDFDTSHHYTASQQQPPIASIPSYIPPAPTPATTATATTLASATGSTTVMTLSPSRAPGRQYPTLSQRVAADPYNSLYPIVPTASLTVMAPPIPITRSGSSVSGSSSSNDSSNRRGSFSQSVHKSLFKNKPGEGDGVDLTLRIGAFKSAQWVTNMILLALINSFFGTILLAIPGFVIALVWKSSETYKYLNIGSYWVGYIVTMVAINVAFFGMLSKIRNDLQKLGT